MAGPIFKVWFSKFKAPWYQLTPEQQDKLMAQATEYAKQLGVENIAFCASAWASEEWHFWGVEKFPDLEAVQKYSDFLFSLNWFNYIESKTYLGTEFSM